MDDKKINEIIEMLDSFASSDDKARMKIKMSDELEEGAVKKEYHHGRCDIGSAFARGKTFDLNNTDRCN
ncbi:MAG: hypothetical protein J6U37_02385 [Lachnospiraceae bacterium]|nr:hypothetical protein [Lachnospiraceae bacterium]